MDRPCDDTQFQNHGMKVQNAGIIDRGRRTLDPAWRQNVRQLAAALKPAIVNGTVLGVFLGDELTCCSNHLSFANLSALADAVRHDLGPGLGLVYTNDGPGTIGQAWPTIPAGLDLLSFDLYDGRSGRHFEVVEVRAALEVIRPKLRPHQRMVLVPGMFGCSNASQSINGTAAANERLLLKKLDACKCRYFHVLVMIVPLPRKSSSNSSVSSLPADWAYANSEPLVAGFMP